MGNTDRKGKKENKDFWGVIQSDERRRGCRGVSSPSEPVTVWVSKKPIAIEIPN